MPGPGNANSTLMPIYKYSMMDKHRMGWDDTLRATESVWFTLHILHSIDSGIHTIIRLYGLIEGLQQAAMARALLPLHRVLLVQHYAQTRPNLNQNTMATSPE